MTNLIELQEETCANIGKCLCIPSNKVPSLGYSTRSCFIKDCNFDGTVFRKGDCAIIEVDDESTVVKIDDYLSIRKCDGNYQQLAIGIKYPLYSTSGEGDNGKKFWSGFNIIKNSQSAIAFPLKNIMRKVILYPLEDIQSQDLFLVVDYTRPFADIPSLLSVPIYPERGEMLLIQGEKIDDIWHGHAQKVDYTNKTVDVFFFVPSARGNQNEGRMFVREMFGRRAKSTVLWASLTGIDEGYWKNQNAWVSTKKVS